MSLFKHEQRPQTEIVRTRDTWEATIGDFFVTVSREADRLTEIAIAPKTYDRLRLPLLQFYPKSVSDLDALRGHLPTLLATLAEEMRKEGMEDLRGEMDKCLDIFRANSRE